MSDQIESTVPIQESNDSTSNKRKHENDLLDDLNEKNLELDESYVTMVDVLKEEEKLEEDAYAVLGGSDDKNCTYDQGYVSRQALYSCRTCMGDNANEENGGIFGICLACSYACHADHELFELYTKRSFRCDCGTDRMKESVCSLNPNKDESNDKNKYNHNFIGKYCLCDKPYPNLEGEDEEMAQCIVCEDWFHSICLGNPFPEDYAEFICKNCMEANHFLWYYQTELVRINDESSKEEKEKEIKNEVSTNGQQVASNQDSIENINNKLNDQSIDEQKLKTSNGDTKLENGDNKPVDQITKSEFDNTNECKLKLLKSKFNIEDKNGNSFWDENWRPKLCKCEECLKMYEDHKVEFLIDEQDTVHYYEEKGKEKAKPMSQYERGLDEISKLNHVAGIEAIMEFKNMSNEFKEHFKKFAEDKKVIEQRDIEEFFANLKYKKKLKLNHASL